MDTRERAGQIRPGDTVTIRSGPAAGTTGIVSAISEGRAHVIDLFHGVYEVPVSCLERQEGSEGRTP
jgi:ribosomal protein L24